MAGAAAGLLGALQFAIDMGWLPPGSYTSIAIGFAYASALDNYLKSRLFPDWATRSHALAKARSKAARTSMGLVSFCLMFGAGVSVLTLVLATQFVPSLLPSNQQQLAALALFTAVVQFPATLAVTLIISPFLLYLPQKSATATLQRTAFETAAPVRVRLISFALLCALLTLPGCAILIVSIFTPLAHIPLGNALVRAMAALIDLLALFILADGLARLFREASGWSPEPAAAG